MASLNVLEKLSFQGKYLDPSETLAIPRTLRDGQIHFHRVHDWWGQQKKDQNSFFRIAILNGQFKCIHGGALSRKISRSVWASSKVAHFAWRWFGQEFSIWLHILAWYCLRSDCSPLSTVFASDFFVQTAQKSVGSHTSSFSLFSAYFVLNNIFSSPNLIVLIDSSLVHVELSE